MKSVICIVVMCLTAGFKAQTNSGIDKPIYTITEQMAEFPGGSTAMTKFIVSNLNFPNSAREANIGGKTFLKFIVDEHGKLNNVEVTKSAGYIELDREAERVVKMMPLWSPAKMKGEAVKCYFTLPISFVLDEVYFLFDPDNKNEFYQKGKDAVIAGNLDEAIRNFEQDRDDPGAWFSLGVIHYLKKDKSASKMYFENVKNSAAAFGSKEMRMSESYLSRYY